MKDLRAQIEKSMDAKLKAYGRTDKAEDKKMMADHETKMHGVKHRAAGGAIEGMPARGRLDRKGGKGKKGDKGKTTVNVMVAAKEDKPPMLPPMMDKPPSPPMPPLAPPMPPAGAMPPPPPGAGGPPMMRAYGGRLKKRAEGGEVEEQGWQEARARFPKVRMPSTPKVSPPSSSGSAGSAAAGAVDMADRALNGPMPRPLRAIIGNSPKKPEEKKEEPANRASGGRLTAGSGSGEGRLEKIDMQKK